MITDWKDVYCAFSWMMVWYLEVALFLRADLIFTISQLDLMFCGFLILNSLSSLLSALYAVFFNFGGQNFAFELSSMCIRSVCMVWMSYQAPCKNFAALKFGMSRTSDSLVKFMKPNCLLWEIYFVKLLAQKSTLG